MNIMEINKYIIKNILSYLKFEAQLNLVKYNKKLMLKLDLSKNIYKKYYFNSFLTPVMLKNKSLIGKFNIVDKKNLSELLSEVEFSRTGMYKNINFFKNTTDLKFIEKYPKLMGSELNISDVKNFEFPCEILNNLEKIYLKNVSNIRFIANDSNSNIQLKKLKYIYLENVSFEKNQKINIIADNLIYLDLRINEKINDSNIKYKIFDYLKNIRSILNFDFLSVFFDNINLNNMDYYGIINTFNVPQKLFTHENTITRLNYFNLEINLKYNEDGDNDKSLFFLPSFVNYGLSCSGRSKYIDLKYMFTKTKNNKFLFESNFDNYIYRNYANYSLKYKQQRICDKRNYNNYHFIDRDIEFSIYEAYPNLGISDDFKDTEFDKIKFLNEDLNVNSFRIEGRFLIPDAKHFFDLICKNDNNMLEIFECNDNNLRNLCGSLSKLLKFKKLKIFKIVDWFSWSYNAYINLFECLSKFKYLFLIEIHEYSPKYQLREKTKREITSLFPGLRIIKSGLEQTIKWQKK